MCQWIVEHRVLGQESIIFMYTITQECMVTGILFLNFWENLKVRELCVHNILYINLYVTVEGGAQCVGP